MGEDFLKKASTTPTWYGPAGFVIANGGKATKVKKRPRREWNSSQYFLINAKGRNEYRPMKVSTMVMMTCLNWKKEACIVAMARRIDEDEVNMGAHSAAALTKAVRSRIVIFSNLTWHEREFY